MKLKLQPVRAWPPARALLGTVSLLSHSFINDRNRIIMKTIRPHIKFSSVYVILLWGLVASCTTTVTDETGLAVNAITFHSPQTRATADGAFPAGSSFKVWGYRTPTGESTPISVFDGVEVTESDGVWSYSGETRYWEKENTYDFYALYPSTIEASSTPQNTYLTIDSHTFGTDDILMAARQNMSGNSPEVVSLTFRHLLSKLQFVVKADKALVGEIKLNSAKLYGLYKKGNYSGETFSADDVAQNGTWLGIDGSIGTSDVPNFNSLYPEGEFVTTDGITAFEDLLVMPYLLDNEVILELNYTIDTTPVTKTFNLALAQIARWEAGKNYRYSITIIDEEHILFEVPTVQPWTSATGGIIIVE